MGATECTLAHELGHSLGLEGCHASIEDEEEEVKVSLEKYSLPLDPLVFLERRGDWGNETGWGFYSRQDVVGEVLNQLLMRETLGDGKIDIPDGIVLSLRPRAVDQSMTWYPKVGARYLLKHNEEIYTNERH